VRVFKWVSIGLGSLIALALIGVLVVVWLVDPNRFKPRIERAVRAATGREFTLAGDIELGFFPWLSLRTGEGRFGNAPGFGNAPMVSWRSAQLGAKLFPLLRGELVADRVHLSGVDLQLIRHADGKANWEGIGASPAQTASTKPESSGAARFSIDGIEIDDSRISFVDEGVPRRIEVTGLHLETDEISLGTPFTDTEIAGTLHLDGFAPAGVAFRLAVPRVELPQDLSRVTAKNFEFSFGALELEGGVQGALGATPRLAGRLESNEFDVRALLAAVGSGAPKTADPNALRVVAVKGDWKFDAGAVAFEPFTLRVDDTRFTGRFRRAAGADPVASLDLAGDALDIARYVPSSDPASEPFILPTAMLKALKFHGTIELGEAKYADTVMKGVTLRLLLDERGLHQSSASKE
jgi:AsmA protein